MQDFIFVIILVVIFFGAFLVAFAKQLVTSAFGLLITLGSVAGIYVYLSADFIAVSQVLIYIGGVIILLLFAIMLTGKMADKLTVTNPAMNRFAAFLFSAGFFAVSAYVILSADLKFFPAQYQSTTRDIGHLFLRDFILPFEFISFLVVVLLVGSTVLIRKELLKTSKDNTKTNEANNPNNLKESKENSHAID